MHSSKRKRVAWSISDELEVNKLPEKSLFQISDIFVYPTSWKTYETEVYSNRGSTVDIIIFFTYGEPQNEI